MRASAEKAINCRQKPFLEQFSGGEPFRQAPVRHLDNYRQQTRYFLMPNNLTGEMLIQIKALRPPPYENIKISFFQEGNFPAGCAPGITGRATLLLNHPLPTSSSNRLWNGLKHLPKQ
jgi:hypothetical protein